jgi:hypothetical protein
MKDIYCEILDLLYSNETYSKLIEGDLAFLEDLGYIAIISSILSVVIFYYIINHPRFNRWWSWFIVCGINAILNLIIGKNEGEYSIENGIAFGIANAIVASAFFIIFSFCLRWWSRNCSTCPYPN